MLPAARRAALALLTTLPAFAVLPRAARTAAAEATVVEGKRTVVRTNVPVARVAERCRDALEAAVTVYERLLPWRLPEGARLVVHLWATADEYRDAVTRGGAPELATNLAATLNATDECHLVLQPRGDPAFLAAVDHLPEMTHFLLCHEGVHQFVRRCQVPGRPLWPAWFEEGMADWLAEQCLAAAAPPGTPLPLYVEDHRHRLLSDIDGGRYVEVERLLHVETTSFERTQSLYAHFHELFRLLAGSPAALATLLRLVPSTTARVAAQPPPERPRAAAAAACAALLEAALGKPEALDPALRRQAQASRPEWFEHRRASQRTADGIVCAGFPGENAMLLAAGAPPGEPFRLEARVEILADPKGQADLYLGFLDRADPRFLKIALGAAGFVTLLAYADGHWQDRYRRNADVPATTFPPDRPVEVALLVDRERLRVSAGGTVLLDAAVPPGYRPLTGAWGIGSTDGVARFREVRVRPQR